MPRVWRSDLSPDADSNERAAVARRILFGKPGDDTVLDGDYSW